MDKSLHVKYNVNVSNHYYTTIEIMQYINSKFIETRLNLLFS